MYLCMYSRMSQQTTTFFLRGNFLFDFFFQFYYFFSHMPPYYIISSFSIMSISYYWSRNINPPSPRQIFLRRPPTLLPYIRQVFLSRNEAGWCNASHHLLCTYILFRILRSCSRLCLPAGPSFLRFPPVCSMLVGSRS